MSFNLIRESLLNLPFVSSKHNFKYEDVKSGNLSNKTAQLVLYFGKETTFAEKYKNPTFSKTKCGTVRLSTYSHWIIENNKLTIDRNSKIIYREIYDFIVRNNKEPKFDNCYFADNNFIFNIGEAIITFSPAEFHLSDIYSGIKCNVNEFEYKENEDLCSPKPW